MLGLELLLAGMLNLTATPVLAEVECRVKTPPRINVLPSKSRVSYDFSKTRAQLNSVDIDTVSPYGPNHKTTVSGLMSGSIQVQNQVSFLYETYDQLGLGCVYLKSIDVKVHIDPTIFIAKELPRGSCLHNAVLAHERKHVREDQLVVNKYANVIGKALESAINHQGAAFGPYDIDRMPVIQKNIQTSLNKIVKKYNQKMNEERQRRQQAIDTLEEYESIGKRCDKNKKRY